MSGNHNDLDPPDLPSTEATAPSTEDRRQIGPYRLLQKIGEGGMGEVWLAEQTEPVKRRVALKIIKQGMETKRVVARFEAERQALAMMDHPAVAKVFDAGTTPRGRPYFVMEHVKGVPITEYCDRHKLTNRERLDLFMQVCAGVQHAHQKAIIHRDLKPSNVLVAEQDGKRLPKIIDFGVAKAMAQKLTEKTMFTELGVLIGTPEYMSPEQAELTGEDVDTRTDVYSLGTILYEMLVGVLPFDSKELRSGGFEGIRKKIREEEPHKPSTRLSTLGDGAIDSARHRGVDRPTLRNQLRGDLDWITMRALEKDRSRRYGSPMELAADIKRYLADEPVLASPPSTYYRTRKFVRRHKVGVGVAATGIVLLTGFALTMMVQASRIAAERDRANRERETSDRVSEFLADMLGDVDPHVLGNALWKDLRNRVSEVRGRRGATETEIEAALARLDETLSGVNATDTALRLLDEEVLARAGATIEQNLANEPRTAGKLEYTLGNTYSKLGLLERAEQHAVRAVEIREASVGAENTDTVRARMLLGEIYSERGRYTDAEEAFREAVEVRSRMLGEGAPGTAYSMNRLAWVIERQGRYIEAIEYRNHTLDVVRRTLGEDHPDTLRCQSSLGHAYIRNGRYAEAEAVLREALERRYHVLGADHPDTLFTRQCLGHVLKELGRYAEAETLYRETLHLTRATMGEDHRRTRTLLSFLAAVQADQGRHAESSALFERYIGESRRLLGEDHPDTLQAMYDTATVYYKHGRYDEAEKLLIEALETRRQVLGYDHPHTLWNMFRLAKLNEKRGRYEEAEKLHRKTLELRRQVLGPDHPNTLSSVNDLADLYKRQGRYDDAHPLVSAYLDSCKREAEKSTDAAASNAYAWLALTCEPEDLRDPESALEFALAANAETGYGNPSYLDTLSLAYHLTGDREQAIEYQSRAIALLPEGDSEMRRTLVKRLARFETEE